MRNRKTDVLKTIEETGAAPWSFASFPLYEPHDDVERDQEHKSECV